MVGYRQRFEQQGEEEKNCISCRYRLQIDLKCQKLEVSVSCIFLYHGQNVFAVSHCIMIARIHVDVDFLDSAKYNGHVLWV